MTTTDKDRLAADIEIVCDNGGGITLMIREGEGVEVTFCHRYNSAAPAVADIKAYIAQGTADGWDGNEPDSVIDTDAEGFDNDCRSGGYRQLTVRELLDIDPENESWFNVRELAAELLGIN